MVNIESTEVQGGNSLAGFSDAFKQFIGRVALQMAQNQLCTQRNGVQFLLSLPLDITQSNMEELNSRALLNALNLNLDQQLIDETLQAVAQAGGMALDSSLDELQVYAIACIVGQTKRLLAVDNLSQVSAGLPIERYLGQLSHPKRLPLIERIRHLCQRWPRCTASLQQRLNHIQQSYELFLQCEQAVLRLGAEAGTHKITMRSHFKLVWLVFVESKQSGQIYNCGLAQNQLAVGLITSFFSRFLFHLPSHILTPILEDVFGTIPTLEAQNLLACEQLLSDTLLKAFGIRHWKNRNDLLSSLLNQDFNIRFIDDFFNWIADKYSGIMGFQKVDETLFLDLDKTLSPLPIGSSLSSDIPSGSIDRAIDFSSDGDWDDDCPNTSSRSLSHDSESLSQEGLDKPAKEGHEPMEVEHEIIRSEATLGTIPEQGRMGVLKWVQCVTQPAKGRRGNKFCQVYFQQVGEEFSKLKARFAGVIEKLVEQRSPQCQDLPVRSGKILNFFLFVMNCLTERLSREQVACVLEVPSKLNCFVWLNTVLINYAYKSVQPCLLDSVEAFGMDAEDAFIPINWLGANIELPPLIANYLLAIEKNLLLFDLWSSLKGFEWLQRVNQRLISSSDMALRKRFLTQVELRVDQLCEGKERLKKRVEMLINFAILHRTALFKTNPANTVILASYCYASRTVDLTTDYRQSIAKWTRIEKHFPEELTPRDQLGRTISFCQFILHLFPHGIELQMSRNSISWAFPAQSQMLEPSPLELSANFQKQLTLGEPLGVIGVPNSKRRFFKGEKLKKQVNQNVVRRVRESGKLLPGLQVMGE